MTVPSLQNNVALPLAMELFVSIRIRDSKCQKCQLRSLGLRYATSFCWPGGEPSGAPTVQDYSMSVTKTTELLADGYSEDRIFMAELMLLTMVLTSLGVSHVHFGSNTRSEASHSDEVSSPWHFRNTFLGRIPRFRKVVNCIQDMDAFTTKIDREQEIRKYPLKC